ncbi:MAG: hypothetical protein M1438_15805, partial [Deltaproteobacteria bacterium]|nr:hypothetical protein [Deltaproteobacteria bacterium]
MNMKLTKNQQLFLQEQIALCTGATQDFELPDDLADLILGITETQMANVDDQGLTDSGHNQPSCSRGLLEPVINQWMAEKISRTSASPPVSLWPDGKRFAVCLTHDVDFVSFAPSCLLRAAGTIFRHVLQGKSGSGRLLIDAVKIGLKAASRLVPRKQERFFEPWMEAEDRYGFRSTFFFFPDQASTYHPLDGPFYHFHDKVEFYGDFISVAQLMRELEKRGCEVGLHGTFESF